MKQRNAVNLKNIINGYILNVNTVRSQIEKGESSPSPHSSPQRRLPGQGEGKG